MSRLYVAKATQLSYAWAEVFLALLKPGVTKLSPVVVTLTEFDDHQLPIENPGVRCALDEVLKGKQTCRTVASTIFPNSLWRPRLQDNAQDLYARYERLWHRIEACRLNSHGVYFRRMTAYSPKMVSVEFEPINQLRHVIDTYGQGNHRHSALQASIFDPTRDHSDARQRGFPCLQQVAFGVFQGGLEVTGFYALQHHITKAYGNYLGLCWLGRFMAKQMNLTLKSVTCIASVLSLGDYGKGDLSNLRGEVSELLSNGQEQRE